MVFSINGAWALGAVYFFPGVGQVALGVTAAIAIGIAIGATIHYVKKKTKSSSQAKTYKDMLSFTLKIRPVYIDKAIGIFLRLFETEQWTNEDLEKERLVILDQILGSDYEQNIDYYMDQLLWEDHPQGFPIMGFPSTISKLTIDDLVTYKRRYFHPGNMVFVVTGGYDQRDFNHISSQLNKVSLSSQRSRLVETRPLPIKERKPDISKIHRNWDVVEVCLSFEIRDMTISRRNLILLNSILGEGVGSHLQRELRENRGVATDIRSDVEEYEDIYFLRIHFSAKKENLSTCLREISKVIKVLKTSVEQKDLDQTLPFYTENLMFLLDDTEELNFRIAYNYLIFKEEYHVTREVEQYKKVSTTDLMRIARNIFNKERLSIVMLGDCRGIKNKRIRALFDNL